MITSWPVSWWKYSGKYGPITENISSPVMLNIKTGEECLGRELPFGACWDVSIHAETLEPEPDYYPAGFDGRSIACMTPRVANLSKRSAWYIDSRASNCTMKNDDKHRCWVRHGVFGESIHVDKNGLTCAAGAGSIQNGEWHGFLHNSVLKP